MKSVTHTVPLFAPMIDGVGDYTLNLARELRRAHAIESRFVVADSRWTFGGETEFPATGPTGFDHGAMQEAIAESATILLHYVGYAYQPKGVPTWLIDALQTWKVGHPSRKLITVFHEIWSAGAPWQSAFFLAPKQKALVGTLLKLSAHSFVSSRCMLERVSELQSTGVTQLPVGANVQPAGKVGGAARSEPPWTVMIFGQEWTRLPAIQKHANLLKTLLTRGELKCAVLMGKGLTGEANGDDVKALQKILPTERISIAGEQSVPDAAEHLANCDFFLSSHPARDICKSSAIMSAFACGCPIITADAADAAPLTEDTHFLSCDGGEDNIENLRAKLNVGILPNVAEKARGWFERYATWPVIARRIADQLK